MDDNNDNPVMPPPGGTFQVPGSQQDLFSSAPASDVTGATAAQPSAAGSGTPLPPPVPGNESAAAPLLTNEVSSGRSEPKRPLIFSDGHPLPSRDGGREPAPAREKSHAAPVRRGSVHLSPGDSVSDATFGTLLAQAREKAGLSREQVRLITKINAGYLSALECSDMKSLPPPVYVSAYVRTLSELYGLDEESTALIREKLNARPGTGDVPSALIQSLEKDGVINEEEDRRLRKIFWFSAAAIVFLLLLAAGVVVMTLLPRSGDTAFPEPAVPENLSGEPAGMEEPAGKPEFTRAEFDALTMPQVPEASTLQMGRKRAVAPQ